MLQIVTGDFAGDAILYSNDMKSTQIPEMDDVPALPDFPSMAWPEAPEAAIVTNFFSIGAAERSFHQRPPPLP